MESKSTAFGLQENYFQRRLTTLQCTWPMPPVELTLAEAEVHVWCASLDQLAGQVQSLAQTLAPDEQERAARFYFERDRVHFMVGRGLLRTILGQYLGCQPEQVRFGYGPFGKPTLLETPSTGKVSFNLAHSAGLVLYAITHDREVGVDLEHLRPIAEMEHIAERFFSPGERRALQALPAPQRQEAFFNCWTRKEAYLKALGSGLARPLAEFEVSLTPGEPARLVNVDNEPEEATRWVIHSLTPAAGYVAALALPAITGLPWQITCWQWA